MRHAVVVGLVWFVFSQGAPFVEVDAWGWCRVTLLGTRISNFGDGDGIADTNETPPLGACSAKTP